MFLEQRLKLCVQDRIAFEPTFNWAEPCLEVATPVKRPVLLVVPLKRLVVADRFLAPEAGRRGLFSQGGTERMLAALVLTWTVIFSRRWNQHSVSPFLAFLVIHFSNELSPHE